MYDLSDGGPSIEQAKSPPSAPSVFTNCGEPKRQETPIKRAQKKLKRVPFTVSRLMEFCTRRELVNQTGHDIPEWPEVVLKELIDNSLDACEEAETPPVISIAVNDGSIIIEDNGPGIPTKTIDGVLDYSVRVSSREAYCSPTRGAQGNALKTILPMAYVLDERRGEEASGITIIEANGIAHQIAFGVDHIRQEPKITHTTKPSSVVQGTRIRVQLPAIDFGEGYKPRDIVADSKDHCIRLADAYAWLNPHLSLKLSWNGENKIDIKASNPEWRKWLPSWPTSAHWYDQGRFRRYMAAHIANCGDITVREFISEFAGMSSTAKQKQVLAETGASHVSLHSFFGLHKANTTNIAKLLASLKKHSKPVKATGLGVIGKEHFYRLMVAAGGDPKTFTYQRSFGETNGVPRVTEFAFGIHHAGLNDGDYRQSRKIVTGVNWSAGINNAFRTWAWRGKPRLAPAGCLCQHFGTGHRGTALSMSARRVY